MLDETVLGIIVLASLSVTCNTVSELIVFLETLKVKGLKPFYGSSH